MKKNILLGVLGLVILFSIVCFFQNPFEKNDKSKAEIVSFEGKTDGADSLKELEQKVPIIIRGVKIDEVDVERDYSKIDGMFLGGHTKSSFKITDVYKNKLNNPKIKVDNNILIYEHAMYDNKTNKIYTINGYENMRKNNEYLLFLTKEEDGIFAPFGVTFGKVSLDKEGENSNDMSLRSLENGVEDYVKEIIDEAREKYLKLKN
ncbi:hypothetical protein PV797_08615 [Clostridiaceae bacterium M8S5]|nr:hypothetical protein PV797_08615 [Clostridiaceae bacterium M8S5]